MAMPGGTKCCPSSTDGKIETVHISFACLSIEETGVGPSEGDQKCIYPVETKYKEYYNGEWQMRVLPTFD